MRRKIIELNVKDSLCANGFPLVFVSMSFFVRNIFELKTTETWADFDPAQ